MPRKGANKNKVATAGSETLPNESSTTSNVAMTAASTYAALSMANAIEDTKLFFPSSSQTPETLAGSPLPTQSSSTISAETSSDKSSAPRVPPRAPYSSCKKADPPPTVWTDVRESETSTALVSVRFEGTMTRSTPKGKVGYHEHVLKLQSSTAFEIIETIALENGRQVIVLDAGVPFRFLDLPPKIQSRVLDFYLAPQGIVGDPITIDGERLKNKKVFAKTFAEGLEHRVGLLGVCRQLNNTCMPHLYAHQIRFDTTTVLLDFLTQTPPSVRPLLRDMHVRAFVRTTAYTAMNLLSEAFNLERLTFEQGVIYEDSVQSAATSFLDEMQPFLEAMEEAQKRQFLLRVQEARKRRSEDGVVVAGAEFRRGGEPIEDLQGPRSAVDVVAFGPRALMSKTGNVVHTAVWGAQFVQCVKERMSSRT